ncbi:TraX family protein [Spiroplasma endosymbiont of Lariophagus distinguendus]|uniref:TraX family protein n=1 Tax=Spiroplasma endosymbiont of Lariophagus distinguendus TaxID=2935082 RepID=UPI00207AE820|nr:TraX family protein [Spiroplasma endosymbiont of Lariophagus distinguendus]
MNKKTSYNSWENLYKTLKLKNKIDYCINNLNNKLFNSMTLKIIALISMIIDHIGLIIFPEIITLRIIGRMALPLYTFIIAFSFNKTKNSDLYFIKLFLMFICLQIPTTWFLYLQKNPTISPFYMNIFANLTLGSAFVIFYQKFNKIFSLIYFIFILFFLIFIQKYNISIITKFAGNQRFIIDYGIFGFLLIPSFWMAKELVFFFYNENKHQRLFTNILSVIFFLILIIFDYFLFWKIDSITSTRSTLNELELWALIDIPFILLFTDYKFNIKNVYVEKTIKYLFWFSYPLTIGITVLISIIIQNK